MARVGLRLKSVLLLAVASAGAFVVSLVAVGPLYGDAPRDSDQFDDLYLIAVLPLATIIGLLLRPPLIRQVRRRMWLFAALALWSFLVTLGLLGLVLGIGVMVIGASGYLLRAGDAGPVRQSSP